MVCRRLLRLSVAELMLLDERLHGSIEVLTEVPALASPAAFGRSSRLKDLTAGLVRAAGAGDRGKIQVASMLVNLGAVTLPRVMAEKLHSGGALEPGKRSAWSTRAGPPCTDASWPTSRGWRAYARSSP